MWWKEHPWETTITSRSDTTEESSGYLKSLNRLGAVRKTGMHPLVLSDVFAAGPTAVSQHLAYACGVLAPDGGCLGGTLE